MQAAALRRWITGTPDRRVDATLAHSSRPTARGNPVAFARHSGNLGALALLGVRGSDGLLAAFDALPHAGRRAAATLCPGLFRSLLAVERGTRAFGRACLGEAARRLKRRCPRFGFSAPLAGQRKSAAWYDARARAGSAEVALLRALKRLAVERLPLLEAHLGRAESPLFLRPPPVRWSPARHADFPRIARRWLNLLCGRNVWLAFRLAEVACTATRDERAAAETLRVCAAVATRPRLFDPFNTFAAMLEAFHFVSSRRPRALGRLLDSGLVETLYLAEPSSTPWHSLRARELALASLVLPARKGVYAPTKSDLKCP